MKRDTGYTLTELLVVLTIITLILSVSLPYVAGMSSRGKVRAAAREITALFRAARYEAVSKKKYIGFEFLKKEDGYHFRKIQDGNANGIRKSDIQKGIDAPLHGDLQIKNRYGNIDFSILSRKSVRKIPPGKGVIENPDDPVKFGRSDIISFSPSGHASSGSIYISDGMNHMMGIVVFGPTVRIRVWDYDYEQNKWRR
jgi:prepilin-type N-terminal cleavage/methylation domain-containing protein